VIENAPPAVLLYPVGLLNVMPTAYALLIPPGQELPARIFPNSRYGPADIDGFEQAVRLGMLNLLVIGSKLIFPPVGPVTLKYAVAVGLQLLGAGSSLTQYL
jgi:hypothetical protein